MGPHHLSIELQRSRACNRMAWQAGPLERWVVEAGPVGGLCEPCSSLSLKRTRALRGPITDYGPIVDLPAVRPRYSLPFPLLHVHGTLALLRLHFAVSLPGLQFPFFGVSVGIPVSG